MEIVGPPALSHELFCTAVKTEKFIRFFREMFFFLLNGSVKTVKVKTEYYHSKKNWIYIKFGRGKYDAKKWKLGGIK